MIAVSAVAFIATSKPYRNLNRSSARGLEKSETVGINDSFGKGAGGFLRQIVPNTACDRPVCIFSGELLSIGTRVRVRRAIGIAFKRDGRHRDDRSLRKPPLQIVVLRLAFCQAESPPVVVDHDTDMIRIVEGRRAALKGSIVEVPLRRRELPDEPGKLAPVLFVTRP